MSTSSSSSVSSMRTGSKNQSLSTIESSVTRLLVSTKHLLESLTQWARKEADDKFVSDAYVKLGNDFRAASRAFTNAGVDISDIGDVPQALRIILEAALSEAPTQENLDRFLPNIRNIIVTLLQNLKSKQVKAKSLSYEIQQREVISDNNDSPVKSTATPSSYRQQVSSNTKSSNQLQGNLSDALARLQKGNSLQRRASKRFSAYQYAKLTNHSPSSNIGRIVSSEASHMADDAIQKSSVNESFENSRSQENDPSYIFLRIDNKTKKINITLPVSFAALRLLFVEKFAYSPGTSSFPEIYIQDPKTGVSYELEEHLLDDVKQGSVLCLNEPETLELVMKKLDSKFQILNTKFDSVTSDILAEVKDALKSIPVNQPPPESKEPHLSSNPSSINREDFKELESIQRDLRVIRQTQNANRAGIKDSVTHLLKRVKDFQESGINVSKSSNRAYMDSCNAKLSEGSDALLTKVDDLQDIMEALRKDVAQRGVRVGDKQLKNTYKEIEKAKTSLQEMTGYIDREKMQWKKIWESELDKVCEEQQFFNLQSDLTQDLEEDIKKIEETFSLIEQCSLEQNKQNAFKRNKFVSQLYIPEPGENIHSIKDEVLNEVAALKPDHEKRLQAINKAEKIREKEREMMRLDKFQEELGDFVDDSKLKKSGGIDEIERMRQLRDSENLKSSFGVI